MGLEEEVGEVAVKVRLEEVDVVLLADEGSGRSGKK